MLVQYALRKNKEGQNAKVMVRASKKAQERRHVMWRGESHVVRRILDLQVARRRPRRRWMDLHRRGQREKRLSERDTWDRNTNGSRRLGPVTSEMGKTEEGIDITVVP